STESEGLVAEGEGATIKMDKGSVTAEGIAVKASHKGNIKLDDVEVKSAAKVGLWAHDEGTTIEMTNGSIQAQTEGGDGIKWSGYHFK
ncbi:hypothetical protein H706_00992, partial [Bartonella bacilliformis CAR600-02]|uniref:hypothetical protein n=1 Tax=Bartonella bacilliformis TaxID=774 RepID=UPI0004A1418B